MLWQLVGKISNLIKWANEPRKRYNHFLNVSEIAFKDLRIVGVTFPSTLSGSVLCTRDSLMIRNK